MLNLDTKITLDAAAIRSPNLTDRFSAADLQSIGLECKAGFERDVIARSKWMRRNEAGMDLALQIAKDKNFPWPGCSNVAFPLVTIATLQFHARAYPAIVSGTDIVKCRVIGQPSEEKTLVANRISTHMSWQLLEEDKAWEEQQDRLLINLPIVGTAFKKSYYSAALGHNVSELVLAKDLVVDYYAKSIEAAPRKTQIVPMFRNEIHEKVLRGTFRDILEEAWYTSLPQVPTGEKTVRADDRQGTIPPQSDETTPFEMLEQHCDLDLDGDGYAEPWIITFERTSGAVVRIVTRFDREDDAERVASGSRRGQIIKIRAMEYFTKYSFIPSPDGGLYDVGFGVLLGPLNESVNSLLNQLVDAGTMSNAAGGFLGRGAKIRGGVYTFAPLEWKRVDSSGDDLRKSIFPLPVREPSAVLFQLLRLLIDYTNRISGTTDMMVGENPGQNTPAETARTMVEMGQKIYTALFKRIWRATKEEFQKLFFLNGRFAPEQGALASREDYLSAPGDICPAADPNLVSNTQKIQQAAALKQAALQTPGYNRDEVERRYLQALGIEGIDQVFQGTEGAPPPKDPKIQVAEMKLQGQQLDLQAKQQQFAMTLMEERRVNNAKILELMAKADESAANAQSEQAYAQVAQINAEITLAKSRNDHLNTQIEHLLRAAEIESSHRIELKKLEKANAGTA